MSSYAVKGANYIFQVKFFDGEGVVIAVNTPTIDVYTFNPDGSKVILETAQNMNEDVNETGRWTYPYLLDATYSHQPVFYGLISALDPSDGTTLRYEIEVAVLEEDNGKGFFSVPEPPPPPSYRSHWNTSDGNNGSQTVSVSNVTPTTTARIPTPSGGEGVPFKVGANAGTNKTVTKATTATFTTSQATTGFGGDSTAVVEVYDKDSLIDSFTTPPITQNMSVVGGQGINVEITQYGVDDAAKYKAKLKVTVNLAQTLPNGGFYRVEITHITDSVSDGGVSYSYVGNEVFIDTDPTSPTIGTLSFIDNNPVIKYLSGISYYDNGSTWRIILTAINNLNGNSIRTSNNIQITSSRYRLPNLNHSPFGSGSANFSGWTNEENNTGTGYDKSDWTLNQNTYRFFGTDASVSAIARDPWSSSPALTDGNHSILIDTYPSDSEDLYEPFDDEDRRQDSTFNNGATTGNWDSTTALVDGEALVQNSYLMMPTESPYTDYSTFKPVGGNPNYTGFSAPANYYRTFVETSGLNQPNFIIVFSGSFVSNATTDLSNSLFEVFIRRIDSPNGDTGVTANPLTLHGAEYNQVLFDDGLTNGSIRLGASSGNTVQATFGGKHCRDGVYFHIRINDSRIKLNSVSLIFPN